MKKMEVLLTEHRELVELYKYQWTSIFYLGVSYIICNGAGLSFLGILLSLQQPRFVLTAILLIVLTIVVLGSIFGLLILERKKVELESLLNKAVVIEDILRDADLPLDTFGSCIVSIRRGKFLADSSGRFVRLRLWQKADLLKGVYWGVIFVACFWFLTSIIIYASL
jgi:hypothetical protein